MKPESEDSSSSSSSSSSSESLDGEAPLKGKMKELPPPLPLKKRNRSQSPPLSRVNTQSLDLDLTPQSRRMINEVDLNLQEEMIDTNMDHDQGAVHTPGPKDLHCV